LAHSDKPINQFTGLDGLIAVVKALALSVKNSGWLDEPEFVTTLRQVLDILEKEDAPQEAKDVVLTFLRTFDPSLIPQLEKNQPPWLRGVIEGKQHPEE
jgi:hypothetical protein